MRYKKILSLLMISSLVISLTACGLEPPIKDKTPSTEQESTVIVDDEEFIEEDPMLDDDKPMSADWAQQKTAEELYKILGSIVTINGTTNLSVLISTKDEYVQGEVDGMQTYEINPETITLKFSDEEFARTLYEYRDNIYIDFIGESMSAEDLFNSEDTQAMLVMTAAFSHAEEYESIQSRYLTEYPDMTEEDAELMAQMSAEIIALLTEDELNEFKSQIEQSAANTITLTAAACYDKQGNFIGELSSAEIVNHFSGGSSNSEDSDFDLAGKQVVSGEVKLSMITPKEDYYVDTYCIIENDKTQNIKVETTVKDSNSFDGSIIETTYYCEKNIVPKKYNVGKTIALSHGDSFVYKLTSSRNMMKEIPSGEIVLVSLLSEEKFDIGIEKYIYNDTNVDVQVTGSNAEAITLMPGEIAGVDISQIWLITDDISAIEETEEN